jgi:putative ABC transport system permease protein
VNTYLRFPSPAAAKAFAARMPAFVVRHGTTDLGANADKTMQLTLLPLTDLHLTPAAARWPARARRS